MEDEGNVRSDIISSTEDSSLRTITSGDIFTNDTTSFDEINEAKYVDLEKEIINDDSWSCLVALIAASDWIYEQDLGLLKKYPSSNDRPAIEVITPTHLNKTLSKIDKETATSEEGNTNVSERTIKAKGMKTKKKGNKVVEQSENLPVVGSINKQALDIKRYILSVKNKKNEETQEETGSINEMELEEVQNKDSKSKQKKRTKGKKMKEDKSEKKKEKKPKQKKKPKTRTPKQPSHTLHDEPRCGPNKYFVLLGFQNVTLITKLIDINVPLVALYSYGKKGGHLNRTETKESNKQIPSKEFDPSSVDLEEDIESKEGSKQKILEIKGNKTIQFWKDVEELINTSTFNYKLNDLTVIHCSPPNLSDYQSRPKKPKQKGKILFDFLAKILYKLARDLREYVHYINTANAINVSWAETILANVFQPYTSMLDEVPIEYVTVEYILHCIIENVASFNDNGQKKSTNIKEDKKCIECKPFVISSKNKIYIKSFMVQQPDLCRISLDLYKNMPYAKLINCLKSETYQSSKFKYQLYLLYQCMDMENLCEEDFEVFIHQIMFSKMLDKIRFTHMVPPFKLKQKRGKLGNVRALNLKKVLLKGETRKNLQKTKSLIEKVKNQKLPSGKLSANEVNSGDEVFRNQRIKELIKLKQFVNCEEIENLKEFSIENNKLLKHDAIEDLNKTELLQSLQSALNKFSNMYFLPYKGTNSLLAFFHNDYNKYGFYRTRSSISLKIPIGFRDYISNEKKIVGEWLKKQIRKIIKIDKAKKSDTNNHAEKNDPNSEESDIIYPLPKKLLGSQFDNDGLTLYNVCEHRLCCDEIRTIFYSNDGVIVTVTINEWIKQYKYLTLLINSFGTIITYHYIINDQHCFFNEPNLYLNITTKDNVIITCIQHIVYQETLIENEITANNTHSEQSKESEKKKTLETLEELPDYKDEYDFNIMLPNGLKIEIRHDKSYIKQYYIEGSNVKNEIKHERCRLYFRNGTVIVIEKKGRVIIMYGNGSKVIINKMIKKQLFENPEQATKEDLKFNKRKDKTKTRNGKQKKIKPNKKYEIVEKKDSSGKSNAKKKEKKIGHVTDSSESKSLENTITEPPKIMVETIFLTDIEIFAWNGEYLKIINDVKSIPTYKCKLRVTKDSSQIVYNKEDGTSGLYKNGSLNVLYPDGTFIKSQISDIGSDELNYIANGIRDAEVIKAYYTEDFNRLFAQYVIPLLEKIAPNISPQAVSEVHQVLYDKLPFLKKKEKSKDDKMKNKNDHKLETLLTYAKKLSIRAEKPTQNDEVSEEKGEDNSKDNEEKEDSDVDEESFLFVNAEYDIQHHLYANVNYKEKEDNWIINLPNELKIAIGQDCNCILSDSSAILIKNMSFTLLSDNSTDKTSISKVNLTKKFQNDNDVVFKTVDSDGRRFQGYANGRINYSDKGTKNKPSQFLLNDSKMYNRFFVIKPDLTGYEFIHNDDNANARSKYSKENKYRNSKEVTYVNSLNIYESMSDLFELSKMNPFKNNKMLKKHLGNFFQRPKRWIFDTPCVKIKKKEDVPIVRPRRPLAVVYRKVRKLKCNFRIIYANLKKAFKKLNLIRNYLFQEFDNKTLFCNDIKPASYMNEHYKSIYKYVGVVPKTISSNQELTKKKKKKKQEKEETK